MFKWYKNWKMLRAKRKQLRLKRKAVIKSMEDRGYLLRKSQDHDYGSADRCGICEEAMYYILRSYLKTNYNGEEFKHFAGPLGLLCPRCNTVYDNDGVSNPIMAQNWGIKNAADTAYRGER